MSHQNGMPSKVMLLLALLQGLGLMVLHQAREFHFWPDQSPQWQVMFYTFLLVWPTTALLSLTQENISKALAWSFGFALVASLLGFYIGYQGMPAKSIRLDNLIFPFVLTMGIATFKGLMYFQQFSSGQPLTYSALFKWSWRNFLTLGLAMAFAGGFWLILFLWGALFKAIGIDFFKELFEQTWFYYPVISMAHCMGIIIFRNLSHVIDTITRLQQALMKFLLVALVFVSLLFLSALPFTGLQALWDSGGSGLVLWMQAIMLFFVNAVYQDDPGTQPYHKWIHRFIYVGVAVLPIYSAISFYGLSLRVDQYGWSLARCWAFLIWFLLALFPLGYCWGIFKLRDRWVEQLSRVNIAAGLVVLVAMLLINSPLLDFRKITVSSQLDRLNTAKITLDKLDIDYMKRNLARPGYLALEELKNKYAESHPQFALRVTAILNGTRGQKTQLPKQEFLDALEVIGGEAPSDLLNAILESQKKEPWNVQNTKKYYLYDIELDGRLPTEFLLIQERKYGVYVSVYYFENGSWEKTSVNNSGSVASDENAAEFIDALKRREVFSIKPRWDDIDINGRSLRVD